jgi:hypothetical protein
MNLAVSLWRLIQEDRLFRWATYASIVVIWFALAWADVRVLFGIPLSAAASGGSAVSGNAGAGSRSQKSTSTCSKQQLLVVYVQRPYRSHTSES